MRQSHVTLLCSSSEGGERCRWLEMRHTHLLASTSPPLSPLPATSGASGIQQFTATGCSHRQTPFPTFPLSPARAAEGMRHQSWTGITETCPNCGLSSRLTAENKRQDGEKLRFSRSCGIIANSRGGNRRRRTPSRTPTVSTTAMWPRTPLGKKRLPLFC